MVKILIAGGDGTVLSTVEKLKSYGINLKKCVFGHVPLGTGNDLSNSLGFGCELKIKHDIESLRKILNKYHLAKFGKVDVWELKLFVDKVINTYLLRPKEKLYQ